MEMAWLVTMDSNPRSMISLSGAVGDDADAGRVLAGGD